MSRSPLDSLSGELLIKDCPEQIPGQLHFDFPGWIEPEPEPQASLSDGELIKLVITALEHRRQVDNFDNEQHPERKRWKNFFRAAFAEAHSTNYEGRVIRGPLYAGINTKLEELTQELHAISPRLTPECFFPDSYRSNAATRIAKEVFGDDYYLGGGRYEALRFQYKLRRERAAQETADGHLPLFATQTLPEGLLNQPAYRQMATSRSCASTSFLMIMDDLIGEVADDSHLSRVIRYEYNDDVIDDEEFIKVLQSDTFKNASGKEPQAVSFIGADFETICTLAERLRKSNPDRKIYCVVNLLSDTTFTTREAGIWHSAVLLSATETHVSIHEPSYDSWETGTTKVPKQEFLRRWAYAHLRGHLIICD